MDEKRHISVMNKVKISEIKNKSIRENVRKTKILSKEQYLSDIRLNKD